MPAPILHLGATVLCTHAGQATPLAPFPRVLLSGQPAVTLTSPYAVAGCALSGTPSPPCVTGQWIMGAARVLAELSGDGLTRMVSLDGQTNMGAYCPLCDNLKALAADWIKRLGVTGPDLIMMDDDYRYAFRNGGIFCACEKHRALFTQELVPEV